MIASGIAPQAKLDPLSYNRLRDKVAIVTGAGQGIGRAAARRMAAEGARVVVADFNGALAAEAVAELQTHKAEAVAVVCDLRLYSSAQDLMREAIDAFGRIDILVNNVGGASRLRPLWEWDEEDLRAEVGRSLWPTLWCCRAVLPHMIKRTSGRIVNVGAESVRNGLWDRAPYNAAKGGVHALTTSIARETAEFGITCNCVAPAATGTQAGRLDRRRADSLTEEEANQVEQAIARMMTTIPMGRPATEQEQAAAIAFLSSDDASYITGQVLSVNGGSSML